MTTQPLPADASIESSNAEPHDHKGFSEEKCTRCGWVMGNPPLNCNNDNTPHVFPSQLVAPPFGEIGYEHSPFRIS